LVINISLKQESNSKNNYWAAEGDDIDFICKNCASKISEGYICENNPHLVLCKRCQDNFNMMRCKHDKEGQHQHLKFRRE